MTLGELIHSYRKENRFSMQEFADKCGVSKAYIGLIELGKTGHGDKGDIDIKLSTYEKIARGLGMNVDDLFATIGKKVQCRSATPIEMYDLLDEDDKKKVGFYIEALLSDVKYKKEDVYNNQVG